MGETWLLIRHARFDDAERAAIATAEAIEPSFSRGSRSELATWGWLMLRAATAAARNNRLDAAGDSMRRARAAAHRIGEDRMDYQEYRSKSFGPAVVTMKAVEIAVVTGDVGGAVRLAREVSLPHHAQRVTSNNINRFRLDLVTLDLERRRPGPALDRLQAIRADAPVWLRQQRYARSLTTRLLERRARSVPAELRELADFLGVEP